MSCGHKCHSGLGLNPWVDSCPICGCENPKYDPQAVCPAERLPFLNIRGPHTFATFGLRFGINFDSIMSAILSGKEEQMDAGKIQAAAKILVAAEKKLVSATEKANAGIAKAVEKATKKATDRSAAKIKAAQEAVQAAQQALAGATK